MTVVLVLGVGNPWRRDDGVGHRVVEEARDRLPAGADVRCVDGEPTRLLDQWEGTDLAVVVDGVRTGAPPGTIHRVDLATEPLMSPRTLSSHGGGVAEAVSLGRAVGRLPHRLVFLGVEIGDTGDGEGLSPPVAAAVPEAAARLLEELTKENA
jgi:hydrogenase maturation protease